jgi:hypothetical protein
MEWDLGIRGIGLLLVMSVGFGLVGQLLAWRLTPHWLWFAATVIYFASGLFVSEVWLGWATEEDLQPNIDGLSFDEVLLLAPLVGLPFLIVAWLVNRRLRAHRRAPERANHADHDSASTPVR